MKTIDWTIKSAGVLAMLALLLVASPSRATLVNGSFEQIDAVHFDGWTEEYTSGDGMVGPSPEASEGVQSAHFMVGARTAPSAAVALQQSFAAMAGETLSFDYRLDLSTMFEPPAFAAASFLVSLTGSGYSETALLTETANWDSLSFPAFSTAGTYMIRFEAQASVSGSILHAMAEVDACVDNVRIVPEPSTLILLATGSIGLLACAWRRRRAT